jgi:CDP-glucose 4,6-dehydratase
MTPSFWQGKRVFITGHTGFKGSWLSLWLSSMGAKVTGYALAVDETPALFEVLQLDGAIDSHVGDVSDFASMSDVLNQAQPDIVFHLAAQSLVKPSYDAPVETYQTNVMGTVNLLEAVRQNGQVKAVVIVTSDKCYENQEWQWPYRENDRLGGHDPYSNSKACAELVTESFRKSFFAGTHTAVATARAGNVIGGGDWAMHRLLPDIIRAQQSGSSLEVRNPDSTRPWQYVLEPLSGYMALAEKLFSDGQDYAEAWNFGPAVEGIQPVRYIVETVADKWPTFQWHTQAHPHHHEAKMLMLDCTKSITRLGWKPQWSMSNMLENTLDWYDAYYSGQDMTTVSLQQIARFSNTPSQLNTISDKHESVYYL